MLNAKQGFRALKTRLTLLFRETSMPTCASLYATYGLHLEKQRKLPVSCGSDGSEIV